MSRGFLQQRNINLVPIDNQYSILWKPDGGGDATTWEGVYALLNQIETPATIFLDGPTNGFTIPPGNYSLFGSSLRTRVFLATPRIINVQNGVMIQNLERIEGSVEFQTNNTTDTVLDCILPSLSVVICGLGAVLRNNGTFPIIRGSAGVTRVLAFFGGSCEVGNPASAILDLPAGTVALLYCVQGSGPFLGNLISGPVGSLVILQHDGSIEFPFPAQPLFFGTFLNNPLGVDGGAGPTSFRPAAGLRPVSVGCEYFDTDIGIPVYWTGAIWVDSAGAPA